MILKVKVCFLLHFVPKQQCTPYDAMAEDKLAEGGTEDEDEERWAAAQDFFLLRKFARVRATARPGNQRAPGPM